MQDDTREDRNVIPRWRPIQAIERRDLSSLSKIETRDFERDKALLADSLKVWRSEPGIESASDIFDAFIVTGDRYLLRESINLLRSSKTAIPPRLRDALRTALTPREDPLVIRRRLVENETSEEFVRQSIRIQKRRIEEFPRSSLSYLELASLYTILGAYSRAERHLVSARALGGDNRAILRATIQFYDIVDDLAEGLKILRASSLLKHDPWIQSAEIAASTILGKSSRTASRSLIEFDKAGIVPRRSSELAMAMATLELASGAKERKVFQLVRKALPNSTENGFAQAIWLSDRSSRDFAMRFPEAEPDPEAHEAKVDLAVKEKDFDAAAISAELWLDDQPFSADAIVRFLNIRSVHAAPNDRSMQVAKRVLYTHGDNWHVLNGCVLALTEGGDFDAAKIALSRLSKCAPEGGSRAFVHAAEGFFDFAEGNFAQGRKAYEAAVTIAKENRDSHLVLNSVMFWLRAEARNQLVSLSAIESIQNLIDRSIDKLHHPDKPFLESVWFSVKQTVSSIDSQMSENADDRLLEPISAFLDEPTFI